MSDCLAKLTGGIAAYEEVSGEKPRCLVMSRVTLRRVILELTGAELKDVDVVRAQLMGLPVVLNDLAPADTIYAVREPPLDV
jgi:hypothetical protein